MKTFRIWNKQDEIIEGVSTEYILQSNDIKPNDEVFLVVDEHENITQIEIVRIIKSVYGLDTNLTVEQTAQAYLDLMVQMEEQAKQDALTLEQQANKISTLEEQQSNTEYILMMGGLV